MRIFGWVLSLLALLCWIGGLATMHLSIMLGSCLAAAGFVCAGAALRRQDDIEQFFGLLLLFGVVVSIARFIAWLL